MIRIHAGKYKGLSINRVKIESTKETASMVREAVFNILYNVNGHVLDLFAGSGSYGITALSLGATNATFIDLNSKAVKTINDNLRKLNLKEVVIKSDYQSFLKNNKIKYDLVFLDPPYDFNNYEQLINNLILHLNEDSKIVLEIFNKTKINLDLINLNLITNKKYGSKKILIFANN